MNNPQLYPNPKVLPPAQRSPKREKSLNQSPSPPLSTPMNPNSLNANSRESYKSRNKNQKKKNLVQEPRKLPEFDESDPDYYDFSQLDSFTGKKNTKSLNHLLNFHYADPAPSSTSNDLPRSRNSRNKEYHRFNKETFLQANFRFFVSPSSDVENHLVNPDFVVNWESIVQVNVTTSETIACPICLELPSVPKITKCGHIYCWACILHYLSDVKRGWKRCPICFESVTRSSLKTVLVEHAPLYSCGDTIRMVLMQRYKDSTLAIPRTQWNSRNSTRVPTSQEETSKFSRVSIVNQPGQIIQKEIGLLESALSSAVSSGEDSAFIMEALTSSKDAYSHLSPRQRHGTHEHQVSVHHPSPAVGKLPVSLWDDESQELNHTNSPEHVPHSTIPSTTTTTTTTTTTITTTTTTSAILSNPSTSSPLPPSLLASHSPPSTSSSALKGSTSSDPYYSFYQASDTQKLFLHPFTMKCLLTEFGSCEFLPAQLECKILAMAEFTLTETLRKRYRFLSHLPLTTQFHFLELDVGALLSSETFNQFTAERKRKEELRKQKEVQEIEKHNTPPLLSSWNSQLEALDGDYSVPMVQTPPQKEEFPAWPTEKNSTKAPEWPNTQKPASSQISYLSAVTSPPPQPKLESLNLPVQQTKKGKKYVVLSSASHRSYK